jgi:hypothetical protein
VLACGDTKSLRRSTEKIIEFGNQSARGIKGGQIGSLSCRWVVKEQGDSPIGMLRKCRRQYRLHYDRDLLLVRWYEDADPRLPSSIRRVPIADVLTMSRMSPDIANPCYLVDDVTVKQAEYGSAENQGQHKFLKKEPIKGRLQIPEERDKANCKRERAYARGNAR